VRTEFADAIQARAHDIAEVINSYLNFNGAWFFQLKENSKGELVLLEVASRLGGSSSLFRNKGINFALLSVFCALGLPVEIQLNSFQVVLDRALHSKFKVDFVFDTVYVDLDDCLIIDGKVNIDLVKFLFQCLNNSKALVLLTRHVYNVSDTLQSFRLNNLFDQIIQISDSTPKSKYIVASSAIFIDDSFRERKEVMINKRIPVFSPDALECLIH
jgi:hypothetical protein